MKIEFNQGRSVRKEDVARIASQLSLESLGHGHDQLLPLMRTALQQNILWNAGVYLELRDGGIYSYDPDLLIVAVGRVLRHPASMNELKDTVIDIGATSVFRQNTLTPISEFSHESGVLVAYPQSR